MIEHTPVVSRSEVNVGFAPIKRVTASAEVWERGRRPHPRLRQSRTPAGRLGGRQPPGLTDPQGTLECNCDDLTIECAATTPCSDSGRRGGGFHAPCARRPR